MELPETVRADEVDRLRICHEARGLIVLACRHHWGRNPNWNDALPTAWLSQWPFSPEHAAILLEALEARARE